MEIEPWENVIVQFGDSLQLGIISQGNLDSFEWQPVSVFSCDNCESPYIKPDNATLVTLTATDIYGCKWNDSLFIKVQDRLALPNAFSPNGDGVNDEFMIAGNYFGKVNFKIFDRWGELIFESTDPAEGWDGTFKGKPSNPGVYIYSIRYIDENRLGLRKGSVTLIR